MHSLDTQLFWFIHGLAHHNQAVDMVVVLITSFFTSLVTISVGVVSVFIIPLWSHRENWFHYFVEGLLITLFTTIAWSFSWLFKYIFSFPRPFELDPLISPIASFAGSSFPSAHATLVFALATSVFFFHKKAGQALFFFAFLVALSRIYVGVHFPSDVIVGALLGIAVPTVLFKIRSRHISKLSTRCLKK